MLVQYSVSGLMCVIYQLAVFLILRYILLCSERIVGQVSPVAGRVAPKDFSWAVGLMENPENTTK